MAATFNWKVQIETNGQLTWAVDRAGFGDDYSQRSPRGINNQRGKWTVIYQGRDPEAQAVLDFINSKMGAEGFNWKAPRCPLALYVCNSLEPRDLGGRLWQYTMEFEKVGVAQ